MIFDNDISSLIPLIGKTAPNAAYAPTTNISGFNHAGYRVVIGPERMDLYGTDDENEVIKMLDWMIAMIEGEAV